MCFSSLRGTIRVPNAYYAWYSRSHPAAGFTLMEIMIVLLILSLTMGLSLVSLHSGLIGNDLKSNLRRMQALSSSVRHQALLDGTPKTLQIQMDGLGGAAYWIQDAQNPDQTNTKRNLLYGDTVLKGIEKTPREYIRAGKVQIVFSRHGLAEQARFILTENGKTVAIDLQAFSPELKVKEVEG